MLTREPDADTLVSALAAAGRAETTPVAFYEAVLGVSRKRQWSIAEAETHVRDFLEAAGVAVQPIQLEQFGGGQAIVSSGVTAGETVVSSGQYRLQPGTRIESTSSDLANTAPNSPDAPEASP